MQNRSTTQQLLIFLSNVFTVHHHLDTIIIYLDISKAFDTICHTHLLQKLPCTTYLIIYGSGSLTNRFLFVSINNSHSYLLPVVSGLLQGSILGALLFILYMNNLPDVIHWSRALLFADDTKYFKHIKSHDDEQSLQTDLHDLASRSVTSHLSFNPSKSIHVSFNQTIFTSYNIRGNPINTTHSHKDSDNLNWNIHHDAILSKAYRTLGLVRRGISTLVKVKLYTSLIRSQVLYCSPVWRPYLIKCIKKLE